MNKHQIEREAESLIQDIAALADKLRHTNKRVFIRMEKEFHKVIAQQLLGHNVHVPLLGEPDNGWTLSDTDLIYHVRQCWMSNAGISIWTDEEIARKYPEAHR